MGRIKPRTVSELMDIANRFADGEDACNNKRTQSPEDDRGSRYNIQRRRSRNYDNYGSVGGFRVTRTWGTTRRTQRFERRGLYA
jgi:hypothetical protein